MEFIIRVQEHTEHEIILQHKLSFSNYTEINLETGIGTNNIISASADLDGFTTLNAICNINNWNKKVLKIDVDKCNEIGNPRIIQAINPSLLLIPKSKEDSIIEYPECYISELLKVADYYKSISVHYTHYSMIKQFPRQEIIRQMILLLNPVFMPFVDEFIWEIDSRFKNNLIDTYEYVVGTIYRRQPKKIQVVNALRYKMVYDEVFGNLEVGRLVPDLN